LSVESPTSKPPPRPDVTNGDAVAWALGVTLAWWITVQQVMLLVPKASQDLVVLFGTQLPIYLGACALFAMRRPGRSFEELFALRRAPALLLVTGLLLGIALHAPAEGINQLVSKVFPMPAQVSEELSTRLVPRDTAHAAVLALIVAGVGPFVEELLYRGALFTGLRSGTTALSATITTGLLFTLVHLEPRWWLPIFLMASCIGYLRAQTGSLWPGVLLHGAFNGMTLALTWAGPRAEKVAASPAVLIASCVLVVLLLLVSARLAQKSVLAERARALDGVQPTGDGATP
jgi:membrane protease YdiL (CAAX protease family)